MAAIEKEKQVQEWKDWLEKCLPPEDGERAIRVFKLFAVYQAATKDMHVAGQLTAAHLSDGR